MKSLNTPLRKIAGSLLVGAFLAGSAFAQSIDVREPTVANGLWGVNLHLQHIDVRTGGSNGSVDSFLAFCIDPFQVSPGSYTPYQLGSLNGPDLATNYNGSQATRTRISNLYSYAYADTLSGANANVNAAAMQLALWEIVSDNGNLAQQSPTDKVWITNSTTTAFPGVVSKAQDYLAYTGTGGQQYSFAVYRSGSNQDYLVATPVPEPGTYAMFLAGLGLMAGIARRRHAS
jgi:hypothetical protein